MKGAKMAKVGRPRIEIDKAEFERLCGMCCTLVEIAYWFKCSEDTIENWCKREYKQNFSECYKNYSSKGRISLRRTQFELSKKNTAMAIWLGKQYLGQRDVVHQEVHATSTIENVAKEIFGNVIDEKTNDSN